MDEKEEIKQTIQTTSTSTTNGNSWADKLKMKDEAGEQKI